MKYLKYLKYLIAFIIIIPVHIICSPVYILMWSIKTVDEILYELRDKK